MIFIVGGRMNGKTKFIMDLNDIKWEHNPNSRVNDGLDAYCMALQYMKEFNTTLLKGENKMEFKKLYDRPMYLEYPTLKEATDILNQLLKIVRTNGKLYVYEVCDITGLSTGINDYSWGWNDLTGAFTQKIMGKWKIFFPTVIFLGSRSAWEEQVKEKIKIVEIADDRIDVIFSNKRDAEVVFGDLVDLACKYGEAQLSDLYDLVGEFWPFEDDRFTDMGWKDLGKVSTFANSVGNWVLRLPKMENLNSYRNDATPINWHALYNGGRYCEDGANVTEEIYLKSIVKYPTMTLKDIEELSKSGEEFQLRYAEGSATTWQNYKIFKGNFVWRALGQSNFEKSRLALSVLLASEFRLDDPDKFPWKPKYGDKYWFVFVNGHGRVTTTYTYFQGDSDDLLRFKLGNCFETWEEAKKDNIVFTKYNSMRKEYDKK